MKQVYSYNNRYVYSDIWTYDSIFFFISAACIKSNYKEWRWWTSVDDKQFSRSNTCSRSIDQNKYKIESKGVYYNKFAQITHMYVVFYPEIK